MMEIGHKCGCHQMPERSFFIHGYQFPLCARCTGLLVGEVIAYFLIPFKIIVSPILAIIFLGIMGVDWFIQFIDILPSTNNRRLISGIMGGIGFTSLFIHLLLCCIKFLKK